MDPLVPEVATIRKITPETASADVKTFEVQPDESEVFSYEPGQYAMLSVFGVGECPVSITSTYEPGAPLEFSIKEVGRVTGALHEAQVGHKIGVRGPYGNHFPVKQWQGRRLLFIGGGIGLAPLRSLINYCVRSRENFGELQLVYGARSPKDLCFKEELFDNWPEVSGMQVHLTVDAAGDDWDGEVALVPDFLEELSFSPDDTIAVTCGPPIMIRFTIEALKRMGFADHKIVTTLEIKMQCGVGNCGRCNIGDKYVCVDGPVFTYQELSSLPQEY